MKRERCLCQRETLNLVVASICITSLGVDLEKKMKKDAEEYAGVFERDRRISSRFL